MTQTILENRANVATDGSLVFLPSSYFFACMISEKWYRTVWYCQNYCTLDLILKNRIYINIYYNFVKVDQFYPEF